MVETGRGGDCLAADTRRAQEGEISGSGPGFLHLNMEKWVDKQGAIMSMGIWRSYFLNKNHFLLLPSKTDDLIFIIEHNG